MCGLCGEIRFDGGDADVAAVDRMAAVLRPRGPDAFGMHVETAAAFGHRRLKIIDLSNRARQPMTDPELGLTIVFNGCIYNHKLLRRELEQQGYRFFSSGDTEVVLKAYHAWGPDCVERLNGMFAFAIHERDSGRVVLARDRLGIKPLYLAHDERGRRLRFASTLPALLAAGDVDTDIDADALNTYMTFHAVVPAPATILKGVRKLPPATYAVFEANGDRRDKVYWDVSFARTAEDLGRGRDEWRELVLDALMAAVKRRTEADVDVGVLLSGGVDSSLIVGLLAKSGATDIQTYSVGFEDAGGEDGNEFEFSDIIAEHFGTRHRKIFADGGRLLDVLPKAIAAMSEPMVSHDNVGFYLLAEEVSRHIKAVQSGQGADEIFGGYAWYPPLKKSNDPAGDYADAFFDRDYAEYRRAVSPAYHVGNVSRDLVDVHFARSGADTAVDKALRLDSTVMLVDDPVKRVDNMTMAWGLEARVPFLDHEVVELAARIPPDEKIRDGGKGILKDAARRVIPAAVIDRPKGYFPVPALKYIDGPCLDYVRDALHARVARGRGLFRDDYIATLLDAPADHITPLQGSKLWQAGLLELWMQEHGI